MQIFKDLDHKRFASSHVTAAYLEIYNEHLTDLLANEGSAEKLQIVEDKKKGGKGVHCMGLSEHPVTSPDDVLRVLQEAQLRRQVGETKMNKTSSRSHCLFTLTVHSKERIPDGSCMTRVGKLHLVDLAGSECAKSAGSESSAQEQERRNINQSLLTLGRVVEALRQIQKNPNAGVRVPYRDSKLSRLLQESLGGRCKTCIIATVSPSVLCCEETMQTLNYADRAHGIKNKPVASARMQMSSSSKAGSQVDAHLEANFHAMEMRCNYMSSQLEEAQSALARAHDKEVELTTRAESAENKGDELTKELESTQSALQQTTAHRDQLDTDLKTTEDRLAATQAELAETQQTLTTTQGELSDVRTELCTVRTSVSSFCEARGQKTIELHTAVLDAVNTGKTSVTSLCEKIEDLHKVVEQGDESMSSWTSTMRKHVSQVHDSFTGLYESHTKSLHSAGQGIAKFMEEEKSLLSKVHEGLGSLLINVEAQEEAEKTQIESINAAQAVVVEATGAQLQALQTQRDIAQEQAQKFEDMKSLQESLQKALVTSVMAGVQNLLAEEMDKLGTAVAEGMEPIQSTNATMQSTATDLTTRVTTMAQELDSVHDVAIQAAKIWGDSGRSTAVSIQEITETNNQCVKTTTAAMASVDEAVASAMSGASEIRNVVDTNSAQWTASLDEAASQLAATKAKGVNAHRATREIVSQQQGELHSFQVYSDEQAAEAIETIGNHNMIEGMAEDLEMQLTGSASAAVSVATICAVPVPEVTKAGVVASVISPLEASTVPPPAAEMIPAEAALVASESSETDDTQDQDAAGNEAETSSTDELNTCPRDETEQVQPEPTSEDVEVSQPVEQEPEAASDDIAADVDEEDEKDEKDEEEEEEEDKADADEADSYEMTMDITNVLAAPAAAAATAVAEAEEAASAAENSAVAAAAEESTVRRLRLTAAANEMKGDRRTTGGTRKSMRSSSRSAKTNGSSDQENISDSNPYVPAKTTAKRASLAATKGDSGQADNTDEKPRRTTRTRRALGTAN
jgi:hypothetical protein